MWSAVMLRHVVGVEPSSVTGFYKTKTVLVLPTQIAAGVVQVIKHAELQTLSTVHAHLAPPFALLGQRSDHPPSLIGSYLGVG
jgi:hypothetical protein